MQISGTFSGLQSSTISPGGNEVDGLPPASSSYYFDAFLNIFICSNNQHHGIYIIWKTVYFSWFSNSNQDIRANRLYSSFSECNLFESLCEPFRQWLGWHFTCGCKLKQNKFQNNSQKWFSWRILKQLKSNEKTTAPKLRWVSMKQALLHHSTNHVNK